MSQKPPKKLKFTQYLSLVVVAIGAILTIISIITPLVGVSTPNPSDTVQKYDCGSPLSPKVSYSDSRQSTDLVCKDPLTARRSNAMLLQVIGFILSLGGTVLFVLPFFRKAPTPPVAE